MNSILRSRKQGMTLRVSPNSRPENSHLTLARGIHPSINDRREWISRNEKAPVRASDDTWAPIILDHDRIGNSKLLLYILNSSLKSDKWEAMTKHCTPYVPHVPQFKRTGARSQSGDKIPRNSCHQCQSYNTWVSSRRRSQKLIPQE